MAARSAGAARLASVAADCDQFRRVCAAPLFARPGLDSAAGSRSRNGLSLPADAPPATEPDRSYAAQRSVNVGPVGSSVRRAGTIAMPKIVKVHAREILDSRGKP